MSINEMNRREFVQTTAAAGIGMASPATSVFGKSTTAPPERWINAARLQASLEQLAQFGRNPEGGVSRVAWTKPDIEGRAWVREKLLAGLKADVRIDAAGNILMRRSGTQNQLPAILFGSHIDSVPHGGNFDGDVGSMSAIEVLRTLQERGVQTRHPLEAVIFSNEEGVNYGKGLFGSRAMIGEFEKGELESVNDAGIPIRESVASVGGDLSRIDSVSRKTGDYRAYIELHIEQGGVLDKSGIQIGLVEGIVGINRYGVTIRGFANHAGTTPMPDRRDALVAASKLVLAVREETVREPGRQVGTVGRLEVAPNAPNVIPGEVRLVVELRDLSMEKVERIYGRIAERARSIAAESGVEITFQLNSSHQPALTTDWVRGVIEAEARVLGLSSLSLPSGAGHDAQSMARITPMGMIFVPSVGGISHSPKELTRWEDVANGAEVLLRTVLAIDSRPL